MSASIGFYTSDGTAFINNMAGSGLGFYGFGGFGTSVQVGVYQDNTFITDPTGASQGPKAQNVKYVSAATGDLGGGDVRNLLNIPNVLSTLNIRVTNSTAIQLSNAQVVIFDRSNINNPATGVTTMVAEVVHPWGTSTPTGSGSTAWKHLGGSGGLINGVTYDLPLALSNSPGTSGLSPNGPATTDTRHDHFLAISASPDSIGSKTLYALYYSVQYT